jgi:aarF domain-containing kinase
MGYDPALVYIDTGMTTSLSPQNLINFLDLFHAITLFDGQKVGHLMIERSVTPHTAIHTNIFQQKMERIIQNVKWSTLSLSKIQFSELLLEVLGMVREHHVKLEGEFANMAVGILLLEGLGRRLDPHVDLISSAIPVLAREQHIRKSLIGFGYRIGMSFKEAYQKDLFPMSF